MLLNVSNVFSTVSAVGAESTIICRSESKKVAGIAESKTKQLPPAVLEHD